MSQYYFAKTHNGVYQLLKCLTVDDTSVSLVFCWLVVSVAFMLPLQSGHAAKFEPCQLTVIIVFGFLPSHNSPIISR
jgi:hypothetical protein